VDGSLPIGRGGSGRTAPRTWSTSRHKEYYAQLATQQVAVAASGAAPFAPSSVGQPAAGASSSAPSSNTSPIRASRWTPNGGMILPARSTGIHLTRMMVSGTIVECLATVEVSSVSVESVLNCVCIGSMDPCRAMDV
jgi:hypothetical protein